MSSDTIIVNLPGFADEIHRFIDAWVPNNITKIGALVSIVIGVVMIFIHLKRTNIYYKKALMDIRKMESEEKQNRRIVKKVKRK